MSGYPGGSRSRSSVFAAADERRRQDEREAAAASERDQAVDRALGGRPSRPVVDFDGVRPLVEMLSNVTGRPMNFASGGVTQRCRACCAEIGTRVADDWSTSLAHAIRFDYDSHRCKPIDVQLHGCSADELTQLHEETEAELVRVADRASAIAAEMRRR